MILSARDIRFAYPGGRQALDGVSFTIGKGERIALLGVNGAGKSTLFQVLNGGLKPASGTLEIDGAPAAHDRKGLRQLRQTAGLVMQDPDDQLFAATVEEDVSFGPSNMDLPADEVRARVEAALSAMGIADLARTPTHMLSFGQKKRVAIAGILAMRPRVLLLDEPTAGLDPRGVDELMQALTALTTAGTAIVIATHDMDLAWAWAERVVVFSRGTIALEGDPAGVFEDAARLRALGLRAPLLHAIGLSLRNAGLIETLPRSESELTTALTATRR